VLVCLVDDSVNQCIHVEVFLLVTLDLDVLDFELAADGQDFIVAEFDKTLVIVVLHSLLFV